MSNLTKVKQFPKGFAWGTATASYQIEGDWNCHGKGPSIWDTFTHKSPSPIVDASTGDDACKSYEKYEEDVKLMQNLGVTHYRFSISWSRVLPTGRLADGVNSQGVEYYKNVVNKLKEAGIEPFITLYHWDLPQALQDEGGWKNQSIVTHFTDFAKLMFRELGGNVKLWLTFNEPWCSTWLGHGDGCHAPGIKEPGDTVYLVAHNILKSHSAVYHEYHKMQLDGKLGITLNGEFCIPKDGNKTDDKAAADRAMQFQIGWFANPIFKNGGYPQIMSTQIDWKSKEQGFPESRLPRFSEEEKVKLQGSADFFGLNFYTSNLVEHKENKMAASYLHDQDLERSLDPNWNGSGSSWLKVTPFGIRGMLNWIKQNYGDIPIYITENGISDNTGSIIDSDRVNYYKEYIDNVRLAIVDDEVNVQGYMAWSLLDNFEWARGYTEKFGLYSVDFTNPERPRLAKNSAKWFAEFIRKYREDNE